MQPTPTHCRHCGAALDALTRLRRTGVCGTAKCRHAAAASHLTESKSRLHEQAKTLVQAQWPGLSAQGLGVVWLRANDPELVAVTEADRTEHAAYLQQVLTEGLLIDPERLSAPSRSVASPAGARLCGQCGGRCCQHGAGWHAFIDLDLLQRWQRQHPGSGPADAVASYMGYLPERHVFGACLYQTEQGCAMPRQQRANICNDYACDALEALQQGHAENPANAMLALTVHNDRVQRAAVIQASATHPLQWPDLEGLADIDNDNDSDSDNNGQGPAPASPAD